MAFVRFVLGLVQVLDIALGHFAHTHVWQMPERQL